MRQTGLGKKWFRTNLNIYLCEHFFTAVSVIVLGEIVVLKYLFFTLKYNSSSLDNIFLNTELGNFDGFL